MCEAKISGLFKICHRKQPNTVVVVEVVTFEQKYSLYKINSQETAEAFILLTYFTFSLLSFSQSLLSFDSNETCYAFRTCTRKAFTKLLHFGVHYIKKYNILTKKTLTMEIKYFIIHGNTLFGVRKI